MDLFPGYNLVKKKNTRLCFLATIYPKENKTLSYEPKILKFEC